MVPTCDVLTEFGSAIGVAAECGRRWGARRRVAMYRVKTRVYVRNEKVQTRREKTSSAKRYICEIVQVCVSLGGPLCVVWGARAGVARRACVVVLGACQMSAPPPGPGRAAQSSKDTTATPFSPSLSSAAAALLRGAASSPHSKGATFSDGTFSDGTRDSLSHHAGAASGRKEPCSSTTAAAQQQPPPAPVHQGRVLPRQASNAALDTFSDGTFSDGAPGAVAQGGRPASSGRFSTRSSAAAVKLSPPPPPTQTRVPPVPPALSSDDAEAQREAAAMRAQVAHAAAQATAAASARRQTALAALAEADAAEAAALEHQREIEEAHEQAQSETDSATGGTSNSDDSMRAQSAALLAAALGGLVGSLPLPLASPMRRVADACLDCSSDVGVAIATVSLLVSAWHAYVAAGQPFDDFDSAVLELASLIESGHVASASTISVTWQTICEQRRAARRQRELLTSASRTAAPLSLTGAAPTTSSTLATSGGLLRGGTSAAPHGIGKSALPLSTAPPVLHDVPLPIVPIWYGAALAEGLMSSVNVSPRAFSMVWDQGPQQLHDLKVSPYAPDTLCSRLHGLSKHQFADYGNVRGVWMEALATQLVWLLKAGRPPLAASGMLVTMLSASLQLLSAMQQERSRIARIETDSSAVEPSVADLETRVLRMIHVVDTVFIPRNRSAMLLVLQSFSWEEGQTAFQMWQAMDAARIKHSESPKVLCEQFLSNVHSVCTGEQARGAGPSNQTPRWQLASQVLGLVEEPLSRASPSEPLLDDVKLLLERDRLWAHTPLAAVGARPPAKRSGTGEVFQAEYDVADDMASLRLERDALRRQVDAYAAGGGPATEGRRVVVGVLDLPYIVSTGKIWPKDLLKFEFNPARKDGKCSHELCFGCQKHSPPITVTHEYEAFLKLNDGHPPTRNARNNKGPRCLQEHEVIWHHQGRCFDLWKEVWAYYDAHPDDPDSARFIKPLTDRELQDRLRAHRRTVG